MRSTASLLVGLTVLGWAGPAGAYTAIAASRADPARTSHVAWGQPTQAQADRAALLGCQEAVRRAGLPPTAARCEVVERQTRRGWGALACGDNGCTSGYGDSEAAVREGVLARCSAPPVIQGCGPANVLAWRDEQIEVFSEFDYRERGLSGSMRLVNDRELSDKRVIAQIDTVADASGHDCHLVAVEKDPAARRRAGDAVSMRMAIVDEKSLEPTGEEFVLQLRGGGALIEAAPARSDSCGMNARYGGRWSRATR